MPLKKILFKPGVNRENTRYTTEGGWYDCDKVRFRQGTPEKIGGWTRFATATFLGVCRSLWNWITLSNFNLIGVGTNLKFYILKGGQYFDITPVRDTVVLNGPFAAVTTSPFSSTITVSDAGHGAITGDFVTFTDAVSLGGNITADVLNQNYQITVININSYTFTAKNPITGVPVVSNASDVGNGGATVTAEYQINTGPETQQALVGWGAGAWGAGYWGTGTASTNILSPLRQWNQYNIGQNLLFGPRGGGVYYWDAAIGTGEPGVNLTTLGDADTPLFQNQIVVSDTSRFALVFGTNDYGGITLDPMLIRWSDQENPFVWTPAATNQAGSVRLSHGSEIITAIQARQEIVTFTDSAIYSLQYLGPPAVWGTQLLGDNISIAGPSAVALASGVVYWMGVDKFYAYDGRVQTLNCDIRRYIFSDLNKDQEQQIFAGTNEGFNEVWWFYCSAGSTVVNKYVIYNYLEKVWYYGTMERSAWLDSGILKYPIAATYLKNIVNHEDGVDDVSTEFPTPIVATISSSEFDIDDGHNFGFIWRVLPDLTFDGSSEEGTTPQVVMTLQGLKNSGSGVTSSAGSPVAKINSYVVTEEFTGQIYTRIRARQLIFKVESTQLGTTWQLGAPRIDIRPDGRR